MNGKYSALTYVNKRVREIQRQIASSFVYLNRRIVEEYLERCRFYKENNWPHYEANFTRYFFHGNPGQVRKYKKGKKIKRQVGIKEKAVPRKAQNKKQIKRKAARTKNPIIVLKSCRDFHSKVSSVCCLCQCMLD